MSNPLCCVMLPTRMRPQKVMRCIRSFYDSATSSDWEMIVAIDDDDTETLALRPIMLKYPRLRLFVGPRLGYDLLDRGYYNTMTHMTDAAVVWVCNDDMVVSGDWCAELKSANGLTTFFQPEFHGLGTSEYRNDTRTGCPLFLNGCWREAGFDVFPAKADYNLTEKLEQMGWPCHFLQGVKVWHDRDEEDAKRIQQ